MTSINTSPKKYTNGQRIHEKILPSLIIRGMQIKATGEHLAPVRMETVKRQEITDSDKDEKKRERFCAVGGNVNQQSHSRKHEVFKKN